MATDNSVKAQIEALKIRIENQLQEVLNDFKKDLSGSLSKFQQGGSLSSTLHKIQEKSPKIMTQITHT